MRTSLKVKGQGRDVTWCAWQVLVIDENDKLRNTKIGGKVIVRPTENNAHQFQSQKVKGQWAN